MSYRQSSFDPNAYEQPGPVIRPFNSFQWLGVVIACLGLLLFLAELGGRFGLIPAWVDDASTSALMLTLIGSLFINSRREPGVQVGSEQLEKNRKVLLVTIAILVLVVGAAALLDSLGAF